MRGLSTRLYTSPIYKQKEEIVLAIEFVNNTKKAVSISKDLRIAFKFHGEKKISESTTGKKKIRMTGLFKVAAGSSVIRKVNLGKQKGLTPGSHLLLFAPSKLQIKTNSGEPKFRNIRTHIQVKGRSAQNIATQSSHLSFTGLSNIYHGSNLIQQAALTSRIPEGLIPPRLCIIEGGNSQQQDIIRAAHADGYYLAANAISVIGPNDRYVSWFGQFSENLSRRVANAFRHIIDDFQHEVFTYRIIGGPRNESASTQPGSRTITIFEPFWRLVPLGRSSMAGRMVHEHSHSSANTLDSAFSQDQCRDIARRSPPEAVENGANYQFFAEG